ncbi:hypothetical protein [Haloplanus salilacus]|uniref:hypothetical protein n=1 Tax=Haloplanus salilacus TaxID=2949994 RepID=UPI0030D0760A
MFRLYHSSRERRRHRGRGTAADPVAFAVDSAEQRSASSRLEADDAASLRADRRVTERGPGTYTVDRVPPRHLTPVDD